MPSARGAARATPLLAVLAALLLGAAPAAAAETTAVESGPLRVEVAEAPFALTVTDSSSGEVLRTLGGPLPEPTDPQGRYGPLGFSFDLRIPVLNNAYLGYYAAAEAETVFFHATEVISSEPAPGGAGRLLTLATNDPSGEHDLELTIAPAGEGGIRIESRVIGPFANRASISGAAFEVAEGERFLGLGERSNAADQTGNEVFNWAEEGPFSSGNGEQLTQNIPDFTFPTGPTASNFPIPWVVLSRGLGVLIDGTHRSRFRFASERDDAWQAEIETDRLALVFFAGPEPADVVRRYSRFTGRQPNPRPWIFGPWFQATGESEPYELADLWRAEDVPVTVAQTYTHYLPCGAHVGNEASERERVAEHHRRGYKITTYFNPHVCTSYQPLYDELAAESLFVENQLGEPYILSNPFTADEMISEIDFTNPRAVERFGELLDEAIDAGYDGWMEDFGEYTPTDSRFDNGRDGLAMHNRYPVLYHRASYRHTRERMGRDAAVFVRSGFHGSQPFSRIVWGGDPTEDWSCSDGLCAAVHQALSIGMSGVAYWGSDIGGFHAVVNGRTTDELNIRWLQFGAVSGVMRTQANGFSFQEDRDERSQVWSPEVKPIWRRYAKLRTQLLPYIEAASRTYQRTGMPITRQLALAFPDDPEAVRSEEELMFGPDLFVAPVVEPDARERSFHLPQGRWLDFWDSVEYRERRGTLRPALPREVKGGDEVTLDAPLEEMPMLIRAGAILPLLPANVDTLANVAPDDQGAGAPDAAIPGKRSSELVELADQRRRMRLLAFPRGRSRAEISAKGEKVISREAKGKKRRLTLKIKGKRNRRYVIRASMATLKHPFEPCRVTLDGKRLKRNRWGYTEERQVLRAKVRVKRGTVRTTGRC